MSNLRPTKHNSFHLYQMDWTRGRTLGSGSSATVSLANSLRSDGGGGVFAVKSVELSRAEPLRREERILSSLKSPFVVGYKGHDLTRENGKLMYNLFMEYMPEGTLGDAVRRGGGQFRESVIGFYARQIVQGLDYIHSQGLVHCDIKSQNILIGEDGAKIADFGCAKWTDGKDDRKVPIAGTPLFMAPEVACGEDQGCPSDVWALGCTIIEMATGGSPWPNVANAVAALYRIGFSEELPWIPNFLSDQARDFLSKCLRRDPRERWTASQLLRHPFVGESELNLQGKQVQESNSNSPTSILDQNFWSSLEESETQGYLEQANVSNYPAERIRKLWNFSRPDNCTWDDDEWVTIRGSTSSENSVSISSHDVELEEVEERHGDEDEGETEDFLDRNFNSSSSSSSSSSKYMKDSLVEESNFNFERDKVHLLITSISISNLLVS